MLTAEPEPPVVPDTEAKPEPSLRNRSTALAFVLAVAAAMALYRLGDKSMWFDESVSWFIARMSTHDFLHTLRYDEANMPLYYAALRGWISLNTDSETWVRMLSAICGIGTVATLYALGRRLFSFNVAIAAATILATNAFFVQHSQEARSYMMAALLTTLATYLFVRAVDTERGWWLYAITVALGIYSHFFVVLVPIAHMLSLTLRPRAPALVRRVTLSLIGAVVLTLPYWFAAVTRGSAQIYENPPLDLGGAAGMVSGFAGGAGPLLAAVVGVAVALAVVATLRIARTNGRSDELWRIGLPLLALAVPTAAIFGTALIGHAPALRYFSFLAPALSMVVARGITALRDRRLVIVAILVIVGLQAIGLAKWYQDPQKEDWRAAVERVQRAGKSGDAIVLYDADRIMLYEYYSKNPYAPNGPRVDFPPRSFNPFPLYRHPLELTRQRLAEIGAEHDRVWYLVPNDSATDTPPVRAQRIAKALEPTHAAAEQDHYFRVGLTRYDRR